MTTIAILAGGESSRMGRDKALLEFDGEKLLERIAREASDLTEVAVVGRTDSEHFDLPGVAFLADRRPGLGPLGGLRTALEQLDGPVVLVGCDMPLVVADALRWLVDAFEESGGAAGLVAETDDGLQPLFAVYTDALLPTIDQMLAAHERSLHRLVRRADLPSRRPTSEVAERLVNVNTPEDFRSLNDR